MQYCIQKPFVQQSARCLMSLHTMASAQLCLNIGGNVEYYKYEVQLSDAVMHYWYECQIQICQSQESGAGLSK